MTPKQKAVTLCWYCQTPQGWRYFPAILERHQGAFRARHGFVSHNGTLQHYPVGRYVLRSYEQGKKVYQNVDTENPTIAVSILHNAQRQAISAARIARQAIATGKAPKPSLTMLKTAVDAYLVDCKTRQAMAAHTNAQLVLSEFVPVVGSIYVRGVTQESILTYQKRLRKRGNGERTVKNKTMRVLSFLRFCGVNTKGMFDKKYMPRVEKKRPRTYDHAQVNQLMAALSGKSKSRGALRIAVLLGLKLGLREQEIAHATWNNVDWKHSVYTVKEKHEYGFTIKNHEQREVPIPADLLTELEKWHKLHPKTKLIVGTASDSPNQHLLRALKRAIKRAGLNCNNCDGCKSREQECYEWDLHTLRRTYITTMLQNGFDVNTIRVYAGHADLATTMVYLRPAAAKDVQDKLNNVSWGSE